MVVLNQIRSIGTRQYFKPSLYNLTAVTPGGDRLLVNTLSGSQVRLSGTAGDEAAQLLSEPQTEVIEANRDLISQLHDLGFLVRADSNEVRKLRYLQSHGTSSSKDLHLIVFPTEKCNFRCIYCYEDFVQGKMAPEMRVALKSYLLAQVKSLRSLHLDWFGGEPLLALDVMGDIIPEIKQACLDSGCWFGGHITTNGYLLTPSVSGQLLEWNVQSFQITLDGPKDEHNKRRLLFKDAVRSEGGGVEGGTFDRILANIRALLSTRNIFDLVIRTNYDLDSLAAMPGWIKALKEMIGDDPRVRVDFCPIWADPCKVAVSIPVGEDKQRTYTELLAAAHAHGLRTNVSEFFSLGALVCYAAKANSMVIRSDGAINKCTVALDSDYNRVGQLRLDGTLQIDVDKFAKWTSSGMEEDTTCQSCGFSASCQGNACPLDRFENHRRPCPPPKNLSGAMINIALSSM